LQSSPVMRPSKPHLWVGLFSYAYLCPLPAVLLSI
jgi:hypothetical protein